MKKITVVISIILFIYSISYGAVNLIQNFSFEVDKGVLTYYGGNNDGQMTNSLPDYFPDGWSYREFPAYSTNYKYTNYYKLTSIVSRSGDYSVQIIADSSVYHYIVSDYIDVTGISNFVLIAYAKLNNISGNGVRIALWFYNNSKNYLDAYVSQPITGTSADWEMLMLTAKAPANTVYVRAGCQTMDGTTGSVWFDDVVLYNNLVNNPSFDFDTGNTPAGWVIGGSGSIWSNINYTWHSGRDSEKRGIKNINCNSNIYHYLYQVLHITEGANYLYKVWLKDNNSGIEPAAGAPRIKIYKGTIVSTLADWYDSVKNSAWHCFESTFSTTASNIISILHYGWQPDYAYFDDVMFAENTCPAPPAWYISPTNNQWVSASVTLQWKDALDGEGEGISDYVVDVDGVTYTSGSASYSVTGLSDGLHRWRVKANDSSSVANGGRWSKGQGTNSYWYFRVDATPPSHVTICSAWNDSSKTTIISNNREQAITGNPYFEWNASSDAGIGLKGYYVYYGDNSAGNPVIFTTNTYYDFSSNGLGAKGTYYFRIKAADLLGNETSVTTLYIVKYNPPYSLTNGKLKIMEDGKVKVLWDVNGDVSSIIGYRIISSVVPISSDMVQTNSSELLINTNMSTTTEYIYDAIKTAGDKTYFAIQAILSGNVADALLIIDTPVTPEGKLYTAGEQVDIENIYGARLILPEGALPYSMKLVVSSRINGIKGESFEKMYSLSDEKIDSMGLIYNFGGNYTGLNKEGEIYIPYKDSDIPDGKNESNLAIYYWDGKEWVYIGGERVNENGKKYIKASIMKLGIYAIKCRNKEMPEGIGKVIVTPNPFTPNGDGYNDYTMISVENKNEVENIVINIYNIKGKKIRELKGKNVWDGKDSKGNYVPIGVYIYEVKIGNKVKSGKIILIK